MYNQILETAIARLRKLRPDDSITGVDNLDRLLIYKPKLKARQLMFLGEMNVLLKPIWELKTAVSERELEHFETLPTTSRLLHYLVVLHRHIFHLGGTQEQREKHYHRLWDETLLTSFTPDHMLLLHWVCLINRAHPPKLLEILLKNEKLTPLCYRRWYYKLFYPLAVSLVPCPQNDSRPKYRDTPRGNFQCSPWTNHADQRLPEELRKVIASDSIGATDIYLTMLNKRWSAGIFALACEKHADQIIRHMAKILPLENGNFSAYDCIIHTILKTGHYDSQDLVHILKLFEETRPGIMKNYHDAYGNSLLRFVYVRERCSFLGEQHEDLKSFLIQAGCDPNEKNALGLSYNDYGTKSIGNTAKHTTKVF